MEPSEQQNQVSLKVAARNWLIAIGFVVAGLGSWFGMAMLIHEAINKVRSGHGLETYRTFWLVEFNWFGVLISLVTIVAVFIAVAVFNVFSYVRERNEIRELEAKYPRES
jgi:hypothetical protein